MKYSLVRRPGAGKPPARFDERDVETEHGEASEAPATERAGNRYAKPKTTAPHLDSTTYRGEGLVLEKTVRDWPRRLSGDRAAFARHLRVVDDRDPARRLRLADSARYL